MDRVKAAYARDNYINGMAVQQMMADAAVIALNREFGFGADRCERFMNALNKAASDMAEIIIDDTDDVIYSREKIDELLKSIVGEDKFSPWEERYTAAISPHRGNREQRRARKQKQKRM